MGASEYLGPTGYFYDPDDHVWVAGGGTHVRIGLDRLNVEGLGDIVYLRLAAPGTAVAAGAEVGSIEAGKMVGPLRSPVSGRICAVNESILSDPRLIQHDPYGAGWLVEIEPADWAGEQCRLLGTEAARGWMDREIERYRGAGWIER